MKDVTSECKIEIEDYNESEFHGLLLKHKDRRLMGIKLKPTGDKSYMDPSNYVNYVKLWDVNKGYNIEIDRSGNFKVWYDPKTSKICKECGRKKE